MRNNYIDNLRWILLLILIPYHTSQAWNTWDEPNYIIFEGNRLISSIIVFFSPYFMPLLFLLAGISTKYTDLTGADGGFSVGQFCFFCY